MNYLYIEKEKAAQVLSVVSKITPQKIVSHALDGSVYIHTIGAGRESASVAIYVATDNERIAMDAAACDGYLVTCEYKGKTYVGYIEGEIEWRTSKDISPSVGTFTLLVEKQ